MPSKQRSVKRAQLLKRPNSRRAQYYCPMEISAARLLFGMSHLPPCICWDVCLSSADRCALRCRERAAAGQADPCLPAAGAAICAAHPQGARVQAARLGARAHRRPCAERRWCECQGRCRARCDPWNPTCFLGLSQTQAIFQSKCPFAAVTIQCQANECDCADVDVCQFLRAFLCSPGQDI